MHTAPRIIDLFAGPGGWDEGLRLLDRDDVVGIEWDTAACTTARHNGHARVKTDISLVDPKAFAAQMLEGTIEGLIASPPCQAWSLAGNRGGEHDREACHQLADRMAEGDDSTGWTEWADPRSALVCQPVRWVRDLRPDWIALEEVPAVKGLWEHFGRIFEGWGYSVWTGLLQAERYGVPQTRKRAILVASRVRNVTEPAPTHSRYYPRTPDKLDTGVLPWVSMADALFASVDPGLWLRMTALPNSAVRPTTHPAPAMAFGNDSASTRWIPRDVDPWIGRRMLSGQRPPEAVRITPQEAATLQTFPRSFTWHGTRPKQFEQIGNAVPPLLASVALRAAGADQ